MLNTDDDDDDDDDCDDDYDDCDVGGRARWTLKTWFWS